MLYIDISPTGKRSAIVVMTDATGLTRCIVGEISRSDCNCVSMVITMADGLIRVAIETGDHCTGHALSNFFADSLRIHPATSISMAGGTASVQSVNISRGGQAAATWGTKN